MRSKRAADVFKNQPPFLSAAAAAAAALAAALPVAAIPWIESIQAAGCGAEGPLGALMRAPRGPRSQHNRVRSSDRHWYIHAAAVSPVDAAFAASAAAKSVADAAAATT